LVFRHVHARRRCAYHHRIAITARTIAVRETFQPVHAVVRTRATAIRIGFGAIGETVIASRRCAYLRHGIAEAALAIAINRARLAVRAIGRT